MLKIQEIKKITKIVKDFEIKPHFDVADLQYFDDSILDKIEDKNFYQKIADINLSHYKSKNFYGGENVWIYKSVKNGHYIYWCYCYGD